MPSIVLWAPDHWTASSAEQEQEWGAASQASALQKPWRSLPGSLERIWQRSPNAEKIHKSFWESIKIHSDQIQEELLSWKHMML